MASSPELPVAGVAALLLLVLLCGSCRGGALPPAMYVFGDSLVDMGNNNHLRSSLLRADFPHNGVDFAGRKATGRFSNGKNAADFYAEKLGLAASPAYLSLPSDSDDATAFLAGVNFASGGARTLDSTNKVINRSSFYHPTQATVGMLTTTAVEGSVPYVYPVNVRQLTEL